jgi:LPXTG-motif cell wall-anchored protein
MGRQWNVLFDVVTSTYASFPYSPYMDAFECGTNTLTNKQTVETDNGSKSDTADVIIKKKCDEKPEKIEVCDLTTNKVITIKKDEFDEKKHSTDLSKCQKTPENVKVCDTTNNSIVTIDRSTYENNKDRYTDDLSKCDTTPTPEQPTTPSELPKTGASDTFMSLLGLGGLTYAAVMYVTSRRSI